MANYKRGKCRYTGRTRTNSETFYRKRVGLVPVKITKELMRLPWSEWRKLWLPPGGNTGRKIGGPFSMMNNDPRWHDILYHTRPRRTRERRVARAIVAGRIDGEDAVWPHNTKPKLYFW